VEKTLSAQVARHLLRKKAQPCLKKNKPGKKAKLLNKHEI